MARQVNLEGRAFLYDAVHQRAPAVLENDGNAHVTDRESMPGLMDESGEGLQSGMPNYLTHAEEEGSPSREGRSMRTRIWGWWFIKL